METKPDVIKPFEQGWYWISWKSWAGGGAVASPTPAYVSKPEPERFVILEKIALPKHGRRQGERRSGEQRREGPAAGFGRRKNRDRRRNRD